MGVSADDLRKHGFPAAGWKNAGLLRVKQELQVYEKPQFPMSISQRSMRHLEPGADDMDDIPSAMVTAARETCVDTCV